MNVFVINHYAANRGDRAVLYFVVRELARNGVTSITVSTHDRSFWADGLSVNGAHVNFVPWGQSVGIPPESSAFRSAALRCGNKFRREWAFPILRTLVRKQRRLNWVRPFSTRGFANALAKADLVIGTGGHHIQTRFTPESLSALTYDMALALVCGKPLVLWSQTIGPLDFISPDNEAFTRGVINGARQVFVRDEKSMAELKKIGADLVRIRRTYDSVVGLNDEISCSVPVSDREKVVGVSVYSAESRTPSVSQNYFASMAALIDFIALTGYRVRFFPMEMTGAAADDRPCIQEVLSRVQRKDACEIVERDLDTVTHLKEVAKCRVFVGHKTHSQIFALTVGTPLLALAYHEKTKDFMGQYGLAGNCVSDSELSPSRLTTLFEMMVKDLDKISTQQFSRSRQYGTEVRRAFAQFLKER